MGVDARDNETGMPLPRLPIDRFMEKIEIDPVSGCWIWTSATTADSGYAVFWDGQRTVYAHRWSYEHHVGPVPVGLQVDHTCHNLSDCPGGSDCSHRRCVNPKHLVPRTAQANLLASPNTVVSINVGKTHCPKGHPYDDENTKLSGEKGRACRECHRARNRAYQARLRLARSK